MHEGNRFADDEPRGGALFWAVRQAVIWIGIGAGLYYMVDGMAFRLPSAPQPTEAAASPRPAPPIRNALVYRADRNGHVLIDGSINGTALHFLVDTGATLVTLAASDAAAAGIDPARLDYKVALNTANGQIRAAPVTLREVRIGQLALDDVSAVVVEHLGTSLLGMSFLSRVDSWEMRDGTLTISW